MADIRSKLNTLYSLEQVSAGNTPIHHVHPMAKPAVTGIYLFCIVSFGRYSAARLSPYLFYPVLVMALADIPWSMILKRRAVVSLPFCLFAGITNVIFDRTPAFAFGAVTVSAGMVSLWVLLLRTLLCVSAVLILVAVTPFSHLTDELRRLSVPELLVALLEMIYRYISVLGEEAASIVTAFRLRGNGEKWPAPRQIGPFVGQLLLRSADRAERTYQAMQCRCYALRDVKKGRKPWSRADWVFLLLGGGTSVLFRFFDFTLFLERWMT